MSKLVQLKRVTNGAGGGATSRRRLWESGSKTPRRWAIFCKFLEKMDILVPFGSHFSIFRAIWKNKIFEIWKPIEQIPPFSSGQVQKTFKILHFRVKFCDLVWLGESRYIAFCNIFSSKSFTRRFAFEEFCFVMKITSFRNMLDQEPRHPQFNFNDLFNKRFPYS